MKRTILLFALILSCSLSANEGFIGEIRMFAGNFAPRNWAYCDGQLLAISSNQTLFAILGTTYGGDGRTTFALPDLRGRVVVGPRNGPGLTPYSLGQKGGTESVTLNQNQIPAHSHAATATVETTVKVPVNDTLGESKNPAANYLAKSQGNSYAEDTTEAALAGPTAVSTATVTVGNSGGSQGHENRPPFTAINYIICTQGVFPSRD